MFLFLCRSFLRCSSSSVEVFYNTVFFTLLFFVLQFFCAATFVCIAVFFALQFFLCADVSFLRCCFCCVAVFFALQIFWRCKSNLGQVSVDGDLWWFGQVRG